MADMTIAQALARHERDVILRDGSTLRLREPRADDEEAIVAFFASLGRDSLYLRFHGFPRIGPELARAVIEPDWQERGALLGTVADGPESPERVVALANYVRLREPRAAEVAFTVADDCQRRGIGTRLLEQLAAQASLVGIERFVATVMPQNRNMLGVFERVGFAIEREQSGGEIEVAFPIAATESYLGAREARDHVSVVASLRPFFQPRTVAVVGASRRRGSIGGELFRNILAADFQGAAYPVNREATPVAGVQAYRSVAEIPEPVELTVLCLPGEHVLEAAQEALKAGCKALCVISAGFAEVGQEGRRRQDELLGLVRAHGARLIGPNCLGVSSAASSLNATFAPRAFPQGPIGFSSQSGALGLAVLEEARSHGLGLSAFVSIGNKADVSSNDLLEWWEDDEATSVVMLYMESFGNPRKFSRIAQRLARTKPVLAMKSGTTSAGRQAASSHTAALAGSEAAVDALFHQAGVIRAETLGELIDTAALLSSQPAPQGDRVAVLTNAGGLGILCADACEAAGLKLAQLSEETQSALREVMPSEASVRNPVDMLGSATAETYRRALPLVLSDPGVDAVIALFVPPVAVDEQDVGLAVSEAAAERPDKPTLCAFISDRGAPQSLRAKATVPAFRYPEAAARALARAWERGRWLKRKAGVAPRLEVDREQAAAVVQESLAKGEDRWLGPEEARRLLEGYRLPLVEERTALSSDEAVQAAEALGYPVVVKTAAPGAHKTESGGVALNLEHASEVRAAVAQIGAPVLVQPFVQGGVELLAGVSQDPLFGPLVAFGVGGIMAELVGDAGFRLAPLTDADAEELVTTGKAGQLVAGFRGQPALDAKALAELVLRLSQLASDFPEVAELDLNPVIASARGLQAVDARVRVRRAERDGSPKTW